MRVTLLAFLVLRCASVHVLAHSLVISNPWAGEYLPANTRKDAHPQTTGPEAMKLATVPRRLLLGDAGTNMVVSCGSYHTCAVLQNGSIKCWGKNFWGQLGLGDNTTRGDKPNQMGDALPAVDLGTGRTARHVSAGMYHTCALLDNGAVKCWGYNYWGRLGLGDTVMRGDKPNQMGDALPAVDLGTGRTARQVSAGMHHTCALLDNGAVKCWGYNYYGQLGLGDTTTRGDQPGEMGDTLPAVDLGANRTALQVSAALYHTCVLLDNGDIKCWGYNDGGRLGLGDTATRGDKPGQMGDSLPAVDLGTGRTARQVSVAAFRTCALLDNGDIKCWGYNDGGQLGLGDTTTRGDQPGEMGDNLPAVNLGTNHTAHQVSVGINHTCALLHNANIKCWGYNFRGQLGLGDTTARGSLPSDMGDTLPAVNLGANRTVRQVSVGASHTCAHLDNGTMKCWGYTYDGALGLGDISARGILQGQMGDALPPVNLSLSVLDPSTLPPLGPDQDTSSGSSIPIGAIVGGVVGGVVILAVIAFALWWCCWRPAHPGSMVQESEQSVEGKAISDLPGYSVTIIGVEGPKK